MFFFVEGENRRATVAFCVCVKRKGGREGGNVGIRALRRDVKTRHTSAAAVMLQTNFLSDVLTTCWDPHSRTIWWERTCGSTAAIQRRTYSNTRHLLSATEQLLKPLFCAWIHHMTFNRLQ